MTEDKAKLLPFYLVIDVSWSMDGDNIEAANEIMPQLVDALARNPILGDKVRFALIDFSDEAQVQLPLCDLLDDDLQLPGLTVRGGTSYAAAFRLLRREIEDNVKQLKADHYSVHRPAVFFLSDGAPTDEDQEWREALRELTEYDRQTGAGFAMYPNLIPFGVADADPKVLQSLIHPSSGTKQMRMYMMDKGNKPAEAIKAMAEILVSSVVNSGNAMVGGSSGVVLPPASQIPVGVSSYGADDDDFL
ncbi:VWA domain-containing protein [Amycolatopsis sp. Hca4]|uniref:vWA domain-containing protein n=1 Tax=Amycolatopsis sp. Hca4 TaxID=2742131 RepID=UPI0015920B8D|nr:VWA domain-containing protein [Amycolatopsis sp. Hca4]QKV75297.1 VWA domain-containing protein [Amycolatopsis sp. Hca4]